ncbi:MAG TPA: DUF6600 domain-containing protein, partial [Verrucomicrobiae bacterium]
AVVVIQQNDDFEQPLSPYGEWVVVNGYGRCWRPARVEVGWRPYSNGHWESTPDGWYWVSDEPWAWATYHYGRWQLAGGYGWVWVPETVWAPAWVSWREGGGYVGWAPMPPEPRGGVSVSVTIAPAAFCFVEERHLHEPVRPNTVIVNNTTIINKTVNITKTKVVNKVVINEGPRVDEVERVSGRKIQQASIADLRHKDEEPVAEKHTNLRARPDRQPEQKPEPRNDARPQQVQDRGRANAVPAVDNVNRPPVQNERQQQRLDQQQRDQQQREKQQQQQQQREQQQKEEQLKQQQAREQQQLDRQKQQAEQQQRLQQQQQQQQQREARPAEKPADQAAPDANNRDRQSNRQQQQREQQQERATPQRQQQNENNPRNARAAERGRNQQNGGTNTTEQAPK